MMLLRNNVIAKKGCDYQDLGLMKNKYCKVELGTFVGWKYILNSNQPMTVFIFLLIYQIEFKF